MPLAQAMIRIAARAAQSDGTLRRSRNRLRLQLAKDEGGVNPPGCISVAHVQRRSTECLYRVYFKRIRLIRQGKKTARHGGQRHTQADTTAVARAAMHGR